MGENGGNPRVTLCEEDRNDIIGRIQGMESSLRVLGKVRPVVTMPTFRGKSDKLSWPMFIAEFNRAATANGWTDSDCCQFLPCFLRGPALPAWEGLEPAIQEDWKAVSTELSKIFALGEGAAELRRTVQNRKQREEEGVDAFSEVIRKEVNRAYIDDHGYNETMRENTKVDLFRNGLRPALRKWILRQPRPKSLRDAVDMARREEELQEELSREESLVARINQIDVLTEKVNQLEVSRQPTTNNSAPQRGPNTFRTGSAQGQQQRQLQGGLTIMPPRSSFNKVQRVPWEVFRAPAKQVRSYLRDRERCPSSFRDAEWAMKKNFHHPALNPRSSQRQYARERQRERNDYRYRRQLSQNEARRSNGNWEQPDREGGSQVDRNPRGGGYRINSVETNSARRSSSPFFTPISLPLLSLLCICLSQLISPLGAFQICPAPNARVEYRDRPRHQNCSVPAPEKTANATIVLYLPRRQPVEIEAFHCRRVHRRACSKTFFGGYLGSNTLTESSSDGAITPQECWQLVVNHELEGRRLERQSENLFVSSTRTVVTLGWFNEETCTDPASGKPEQGLYFELRKGKISSVDGHRGWSNLVSRFECDLQSTYCILSPLGGKGVIVWAREKVERWCTTTKSGRYLAYISPTSISINETSSTLLFAKRVVPERLQHCFGDSPVHTLANDAYAVFETGAPDFIPPAALNLHSRAKRHEEGELPSYQEWKSLRKAATLGFKTPNRLVTSTTQVPRGETMKQMNHSMARTENTTWLPPSTRMRTIETQPTTTFTPWSQRATAPARGRTTPTGPTPLAVIMVTTNMASTVTTLPRRDKQLHPIVEVWRKRFPSTDEQREFSKPRKLRNSPALKESSTIQPSYVREFNSKSQFAQRHAEDVNRQNFNQAFHISCENHNKVVDAFNAIADIDVTIAVRRWLSREDITAEFIGDVIAVRECERIVPDLIFYNHNKMDGKCYEHTPMKVGNQTWFRMKGRPDLIPHATIVDCDTIDTSPVMWINGSYQDARGKVRVDGMDHRNVTYRRTSLTLPHDKGALYPSDTDTLEAKIDSIQAYINRVSVEEKRVHPPPASPVQGSISDKISSFVTNASEGVKNVGKEIKGTIASWERMVKMIAAIIGVVIVIGALIFFAPCWQPIYSAIAAMLRSRRQQQQAALEQSALEYFPEAPLAVYAVDTENTTTLVAPLLSPQPSAPPCYEECVYRPEKPIIRRWIPPSFEVQVPGIKQPKIQINSGSEAITALYDTGSAITYCKHSIFQRIWPTRSLSAPEVTSARAANGTPIPFMGQTLANLRINTLISSMIRILVARDDLCPVDLLLGIDWLTSLNRSGFEVVVNMAQERLYVLPTTGIASYRLEGLPLCAATADWLPTDAYFHERNPTKRPVVRVQEDCVLQPHSDTFLWGYVDGKLDNNDDLYLVEDGPVWRHSEFVLVGATVHSPGREGTMPVRLMNHGNAPVRLYQGMGIAYLQRVDQKAVTIDSLNSVNALCTEENVPRESEYWPKETRWARDLPQYPVRDENWLAKLDLRNCVMSDEKKQLLQQLILKYSDAFVGPDGLLGRFTGPVEHKIDLIDETQYVQSRPYRVSPNLKPEVERQIEELLRQGLIRPSTSPFSSPIILVPKADGKSWRFVVDYRKLNKNTRRQTYYLPLIADILDETAGCRLFSIFDFQSGYWQIPMHPAHAERTAFCCFAGHFEWTVMAQGLCSAPQRWMQAMDILKKDISAAFLIYLDDVILGSQDESSHLVDIEQLLKALVKHGLKLRLDKCAFGRSEVRYLGHLISEAGIRPDPKNVAAVANFKAPTTLTELRSLIGALSYFRKFIKNFAELIAPLNELTSQEGLIRTHWTESHQRAMDQIVHRLVTAPVLAAPNFKKPFIIETDASQTALGACLLQEDSTHLVRPVCYASRKLKMNERKFSTIELEALGVVFAITQFRPYIEGNGPTVVRTDNSALTTALTSKNASPRLMRFQIALQAYELKITHRSGATNTLCDHLSRYPTDTVEDEVEFPKVCALEDEIVESEENTRAYTDHREELRRHTQADETLQTVIREMTRNWAEELSRNHPAKPFAEIRDELILDRGVLWRSGVLVIPETLRLELLQKLHATHMGKTKMKARARKLWWWPRMTTDIEEFAQNCEVCRRLAPENPNRSLVPWPKAMTPNERWHMDYAGPYRNAMWLIVVDAHSRFAWVKRTVSTTSTATIDMLDELFCTFGSPTTLVSDNGPQFVSRETEEFLRDHGVRHIMSAPYHPQSNGEAERFVGQFKLTVNKIMDDPNNRPRVSLIRAVRMFLQYYRSTPHTVTEETPSLRYLKREMHTPLDSYSASITAPPAVRAEQASKKRVRVRQFAINQDVWVRNYRRGTKWEPGVIVESRGEAMYGVHMDDDSSRVVHADQLNERKRMIPRGVSTRPAIVMAEQEPDSQICAMKIEACD